MRTVYEIADLREQVQHNRRELIRTELQTCFIALDRARFELSLGESYEARKEYSIVCHAMQTIERFLRQASSDMTEVESQLAELKASVESLRIELETFPA